MRLSQLASRPNLDLAWRRITTGGNYQYKQLYRSLYYAYEVALDANLRDLRQRLLGGAFVPRHPERIYVPKPSGLHRPLALLNIEDQIILQAFANLAAKRMQRRRAPLQFTVVFSNILEKPDSIFFFRRWQETYGAFQRRIRKHCQGGMRWVGDFDLPAFYDTISHERLLRTIYPRRPPLRGHGGRCSSGPDRTRIPLPRAGPHIADGHVCDKRAESVQDAMGMLPSIWDPQHEAGAEKIDKKEARWAFLSAIGGKQYRVTDKTRLRYVLYRAEPDSDLFKLVLRPIPHHPEHADAFFAYLGRFEYRKPIERLCRALVENNPYPYVRGEAWHVLAHYRRESRSMTASDPKALTTRAIAIAKQKTQENFVERWGACHFLCMSKELTTSGHSRFLKYQAPLLQSLLASVLLDVAFAKGGVVETYLGRTTPEPGLSVCSALHERGLTPATFGLKVGNLPSQVANTLRELGVVSAPGPKVDPIAEIVEARYGAPRRKSWHRLLGGEYVHALGLLKQAEAAFAGGRSFWLACQNSFNQTVFLALQRHLQATSHPAACTTADNRGQLVDFGVTLDANGPFSKNWPTIGDCFREMNTRRNHVPVSHPYEKKTAAQPRHLKAQERNEFVAKLRNAYADLVVLMP